jgi:uncharacterized protein (TIGR03435 family)
VRHIALAACAILFMPWLAPAQPTSEPSVTFEVASIKLNTTAETNRSINWAPGGQLNCTNVPLRMLVTFAYDLRDYQIAGLPAWADSDFYNILAKPSAEEAAKEANVHSQVSLARLRRRTQALLAERFGLTVHTEEREMSVYALVVAKGGPKLGEAKPADNLPESGPDGPQITWNSQRVRCKNVTMKRFAETMVSARMGRSVIDKTGLTGAYEFNMEYGPDEATDANRPPFQTALQEQLGLKLETVKAPVKTLMIDKVEKPTAN